MAMKIALIPLRRSATIETIITDREVNDKQNRLLTTQYVTM